MRRILASVFLLCWACLMFVPALGAQSCSGTVAQASDSPPAGILVDGKQELPGNNSHLLQAALEKAATQSKASVLIREADVDGSELKVKLEVGALPPGHKRGELFVAVADNSDETPVKGGENSGRELRHVAVLRSLQKVAKVGQEGLQKDFEIRLPRDLAKDNLR